MWRRILPERLGVCTSSAGPSAGEGPHSSEGRTGRDAHPLDAEPRAEDDARYLLQA